MKSLPVKSTSTLFIILAIGLFTVANSADWVAFNGGMAEEYDVRIISSDNSATILEFYIPGMYVEDVIVNDLNYQRLRLFTNATTQEVGSPALPVLAELVGIPDKSNVKVSVVSSQTMMLEGYNIIPFQQPTTDAGSTPDFQINEPVYASHAWLPDESVTLGSIGIMRDLRIVPLRIVPFRWNPSTGQLEVSTRLIVRLDYSGISNEAVRTTPPGDATPRMDNFYRSAVVNYDFMDIPLAEATDEFQVKYLIICPDADAQAIIEPLAEFRNAQGYGVEVRLMEAGFNTATDFRDYIHDLYLSDGLEYVLLVGDYCTATGHEIMPMYYWVDSWSDSWYSMVDPWPNNGNDYYADLAVGRFVYDDLNELQHQMDKTMGYLLNPSTEDNWAEHSLLVAHDEEYPLKYTQCCEEIRTFNYALQTPIFQQGYGGAGYTNNDVINYLNNTGSGILNYRGHGGQTEWWNWGPTGSFTAVHINQLTNEDKLFVHFDVCCDNMDFPGYNGDCFAESFMKADYGCVAIHSAIIPSYTIPNHDYDKEFYKAIFNEGIVNIGYATNFANVTVYEVHGWLGESNIRTYLWLGDSAIDPWTNTPEQLIVSHLPVVNIGSTTLDVSVLMGGFPVEDAMVCAQNNETYSVGYTNAAGLVTLMFDAALMQPGELQLTVTCHNGLPYQADIQVIPAAGPYVVASECEVADASGWLPNGQVDYAETTSLTLTMENVGVDPATNVNVTVSCLDDLMTVTDNNEDYGTIDADQSVTVTEGFEISIEPGTPDGHIFLMYVTATATEDTWESIFALVGHAPELSLDHLEFDDPAGNNNNWLDPGETALMTVFINNDGSSPCYTLNGTLSSLDPNLTVTGPTGEFGQIQPGETGSAEFGVYASPDTPQEYLAEVQLDCDGLNEFSSELIFPVMIGNHLYNPTGPDNYGYRAYDPFDTPESPVFDWVEISADSGGLGELVDFLVDDSCANLNLPFSFQYYGVTYDEYTIGTNGWIAMGTVTEEDYSNSAIPNVDGPPNMIAPYWEDLSPQRPNSGKVWRWHDTDNHRIVVEYNHIEQYTPENSFETFQVILFDPAYYPTETGDGRILFQYKEMSATVQIEGTIGIENQNETDGVEYLYDDTYDQYAHPVTDQFAIMVTTPAVEVFTLQIDITPQNPPIFIQSWGGSFQWDVVIENLSGAPITFDAWTEVLLPNGNPYGPLNLYEDLTLEADQTLTASPVQYVPQYAPNGMYTYFGKVGNYPDVITSDSFEFGKLPLADAGMQGIDDPSGWTLTGWFDELSNISASADEIPSEYYLDQAYPNPFNPKTSISFGLPVSGLVEMRVYNIMGREVAVLQNGRLEAGKHTACFDAAGLASGIYFYRIKTDGFTAMKKMVLVK